MAKRENYKIADKEKDIYVNKEWTAAAIQEWLKENGTKEQQAKYWELFNAVVMKDDKPVLYKTGEKAGEPKVKGHIATLSWFKETFPKYPKK